MICADCKDPSKKIVAEFYDSKGTRGYCAGCQGKGLVEYL